jgi:hypothetical protein
MIVKQLLKMESDTEEAEIDSPRLRQLEQVDAADKTKLYITLDNMLDYLQVYRDKLKGSRVPFYQAKFLE